MAGLVRHRVYKPVTNNAKLLRNIRHNYLALLRTKSVMTILSYKAFLPKPLTKKHRPNGRRFLFILTIRNRCQI